MKSKKNRILYLFISLIIISFSGCTNEQPNINIPHTDSKSAFNYIKGLEGKWVVKSDKEGIFGWEFNVTSRKGVIVERLKVGTPTEMVTVYHLDDGILKANHFCQLQNQPNLIAVSSKTDGDIHFLCNGKVGSTKSHDELHMHGVHFKKKDKSLLIWMDMVENGKVAFVTKYELFRVDSKKKNSVVL